MTGWDWTVKSTEQWDVKLLDNGHVAFVFVVDGKVNGAILRDRHLGMYVGRILNAVTESMANSSARPIGDETITAVPIGVTDFGFGRGRSDEEFMLTLRCGRLDMTFALEAAKLRKDCADLLSGQWGSATTKRN